MSQRNATGKTTNTTEFPSFTSLKLHQRRAVILRAEGKTIAQITAHINNEFVLTYSEITVKEWFHAGGKLEQAYNEYIEADAAMSLKQARLAIKRASKNAVATVLDQMRSPDGRLALDAAKTILNKYVPDRQVVHDGPEDDGDIPDELTNIANAIAMEPEENNEQKPVDDAPEGVQDTAGAGAEGSADVPKELLQQPNPADGTSDQKA